jgi:hypothetical protein
MADSETTAEADPFKLAPEARCLYDAAKVQFPHLPEWDKLSFIIRLKWEDVAAGLVKERP